MLTVVDIIKLMLKFVNIWYVNQHGPVWSRMVINVLKLIIFICRKLLYYSVIIPYDPDQGSGNGVQDIFIEPPLGIFEWFLSSSDILGLLVYSFKAYWYILIFLRDFGEKNSLYRDILVFTLSKAAVLCLFFFTDRNSRFQPCFLLTYPLIA